MFDSDQIFNEITLDKLEIYIYFFILDFFFILGIFKAPEIDLEFIFSWLTIGIFFVLILRGLEVNRIISRIDDNLISHVLFSSQKIIKYHGWFHIDNDSIFGNNFLGRNS